LRRRQGQRLAAAVSTSVEKGDVAMILRAMSFTGALAILAVGAVHLQQYIGEDAASRLDYGAAR
jgi:acyl-coenzyme A synthetase/AMP-(fatty) acid ligase